MTHGWTCLPRFELHDPIPMATKNKPKDPMVLRLELVWLVES